MPENSVSVENRKKVHGLCRDFLSGQWTEVSEDDLIIKPVTDGFVNKSFSCFLPENSETKPNKVFVRIVDYESQKQYYDYSHILAISLLLSEKGIAPKLLGCFQYGTIIEYVPSRYFSAQDDKDEKLVNQLASKLADLHSLRIPIPKDRAEKDLSLVFDTWFDEKQKEAYLSGRTRRAIEADKHQLLAEHNYVEETSWLRRAIARMDSPIVLSHNDFNRRNILVTEESGEPSIVLIDFDWTCYGYRGTDIGQYFANYGQTESDFQYTPFPTEEQMSVFIDGYIRRMTEIFGENYVKQEINSRERLVKEAKLFAMYAMLKDIQYCLYRCTVLDDKPFLSNGETRYRSYVELKDKFLNEYPEFDI